MVNLVGQQVGSYRIIRKLGEGGFAEVYLGEHVYLKSLAAIKMVSMQFGETEKASFLAEARTLVALKHPHIVQILDFGMEGQTPFLVMEYAPHGTLRQLHPKETRLPLGIIVSYVNQVASALQYAHDQRLIHRDIKPENMLLGENNNILLADFGIAVIAQSTYQSRKAMVGTAAYMSPEQITGKPNLASDQYSLGVVVYEWLCGSKPFQGTFTELCAQHIYAAPPPLREKLPTLPLEVEQVVQTVLAKDPGQRFGSIQAFATALEQAHQSSLRSPGIVQSPPLRMPAATYHAAPQDLQYATIPGEQEDSHAQFDAPRRQGHTLYGRNGEQTQPSSLPQPKSLSRKARPTLVALFTILALIVLLGGGGLLYFTAFAHPGRAVTNSQLKPTAAVQAKATTMPQPSPTPQITATPIPTATPTPQDLYLMATSTTPVLNDALASPDTNNWDVAAGTTGCNYTGGTYEVKDTQPSTFIPCYAQATQFHNFAFQIDVKILSGAQRDGGGIIFGATQNENYRLRLGVDGSYDLVNQERPLLNGSSPAIKAGLQQTNTLTVIAKGQHIYLYINQQFIADANGDATISGKIGVMAVCWTKSTKLAFSNAKVWQL